LYGSYPTEFAGSAQNLGKIVGTSNQPIRKKILPKKVCLVSSKCKGALNSYEGYPMEFAGSTQNRKKKFGTSNQPIRTKIFPKKTMFGTLKV
jgi:hypothetical protein